MRGLMDNVSKPLIGVLVATVAVFALWVVALKPNASTKGTNSSNPGLGQFQSAINAAHNAVKQSAADNARAGGASAGATTSSSPAASPANPSTTASPTATTTHAAAKSQAPNTSRAAAANPVATPATRLNTVEQGLRAHKAVALLFFNPAAADDQAVKHELSLVPVHRGRVVKLAIPLTELPSYTVVTGQVPVNVSPTLVVISRNGQAGEIVGFSDKFEITQRVDDALAAPR
jgi:hypothetical protein